MKYENNYWKNVNVVKVNFERATSVDAESFSDYFSDLSVFQSKNILLDLCDCNFIDSTFLGMIVRIFLSLKKNDFLMKIVGNDKVLFLLLDVSRLGSVIEIFNNVETAIDSFE